MKRTWMKPTVAAAAAALVAASCYVRPANVASRYVKSVFVVAERGAVIEVARDESPELAGTRLAIEPGALAEDTTITLEIGLDPIVHGEAIPAGPVAIFGPPGTVFSKPARLTLPVTLTGTQSEADLFIQIEEENGERATIPRELLDVAQATASFGVNGFTSFQPGTLNQLPQDAGTDAGQDGGTACGSHADCPATDLCLNGFCKTCTGGACSGMCTSNLHCQTGRVCVGGQCVQNVLDGGTDGGHDGGTQCDPLLQNCHVAGEYCYFDVALQTPGAYCSTPGSRDRGQSCTSPTDCFTTTPTSKALHCHGLSFLGGSGHCRDYCDVTVPNHGSCAQVPVPQTCRPILPGASIVGYCDPTCVGLGGGRLACGAGMFCCGEDKDRDGVAEPCPSTGVGTDYCYAAPSPPFCTTCLTDADCQQYPNPSGSTLPALCLYAGNRPDGGTGVKVCAPATFNDAAPNSFSVPKHLAACPAKYFAHVEKVGCSSNADCGPNGTCGADPASNGLDGGPVLRCLCLADGTPNTSWPCPVLDGGAQTYCNGMAPSNTTTTCVQSVVCLPPPSMAYAPADGGSGGCGL